MVGRGGPEAFPGPSRPGWVPSSLLPPVPVLHLITGHGKDLTVPEQSRGPKLRTKGAKNLVSPYPEEEAGPAQPP